jgi:hypothetical protein
VLAAPEPQKFELAINLETAKALGTMMLPEFLVHAGEVIQ